jgi:hypothetical protein
MHADLCEAWGYRLAFALIQFWGAAVTLGFYFVPEGGTAGALVLFAMMGIPWTAHGQLAWTIITMVLGEREDTGLVCMTARAVVELVPVILMGLLS